MRRVLTLSLCFVTTAVFICAIASYFHTINKSQTNPVPPSNMAAGITPAIVGAAQARVEVDCLEHDFGVIDADENYEHTFLITNKGQAKLELRSGGSSCKCVLSKLPVRVLDPGHATKIRIVAKTRDKSGPFNDRVEIHTNDPQRETLTFQIRGNIRKFLGCDPPRVQWSNLRCSENRSAEVVVYSQTWDKFVINSIEPSLPEIRCEVATADAQCLNELSACCGYRLKVTLPAGAISPTSSDFHETLHLRTTPPGKEGASRTLMLVLAGSVERQVRFFGRKVDGGGILRLGAVAAGENTRERIVVRLKKTQSPVSISSVETKPAFLKAHLCENNAKPSNSGVFQLDVEIPADAPACNHLGSARGSICMRTDRPDMPEITLDVEFAVLGNNQQQYSQ